MCGITRTWNPEDDPDKEKMTLTETIPVAGHWAQNTGKGLEYKWTRLKETDSSEDGLQLELWGKKYGRLMQKAVIHLQCDPKRTGNDDADEEDDKQARDADDDEDDDDKDNSRDLRFVSYGEVDTKDGKMKVLRLNWRTKFACENYKNGNGSEDASESWGFFTWFILM